MKWSGEIYIQASAERVFRYVTTHEIRKYWQEELVSTIVHDPVSEDGIRFKERFTDIIKEDGKLIQCSGLIFEFDQIAVCSFQIQYRLYTMYLYFRFISVNNDTRLSYQLVVQVDNPFLKWVALFFKSKFEKQLHKRLSLLKRLTEN